MARIALTLKGKGVLHFPTYRLEAPSDINHGRWRDFTANLPELVHIQLGVCTNVL